MRSKTIRPEVADALQIGTDSEGGYLVPDEFENTLVEALEEENIKINYISGTSSGSIVASLYAMGYRPEEIYNLFKKYSKKIK